VAAAQSADAKIITRRIALFGFGLEGRSRAEAARSCEMDRQTLRDWVIRYDEEGLGGLLDRRVVADHPRS
jgi:transposase-like protein